MRNDLQALCLLMIYMMTEHFYLYLCSVFMTVYNDKYEVEIRYKTGVTEQKQAKSVTRVAKIAPDQNGAQNRAHFRAHHFFRAPHVPAPKTSEK